VSRRFAAASGGTGQLRLSKISDKINSSGTV